MVRMATSLQRVSFIPSCWDTVLDSLDLESIKSLRLVNRTLAQQCLVSRFTRQIAKQDTDLSRKSLDQLLALASNPLGHHMKAIHVSTRLTYQNLQTLERLATHPLGTYVRSIHLLCVEYDVDGYLSMHELTFGRRPSIVHDESHQPLLDAWKRPDAYEIMEEASSRTAEWLIHMEREQDAWQNDPAVAATLTSCFRKFWRLKSLVLEAIRCYGPGDPGVGRDAWGETLPNRRILAMVTSGLRESGIELDSWAFY